MTDFFTNLGDSLLRFSGQKGGFPGAQQQNSGLYTGNIPIFANWFQAPQLTDWNTLAMKGLSIEHGQDEVTTEEHEPVQLLSSAPEQPAAVKERGASEETPLAEETPSPAPTAERVAAKNNPAANAPQSAGGLHSPVELSDALTIEEVNEELYNKWIEQGHKGHLPSLPGEIVEGEWYDFFKNTDNEIICRDSSGKTQNIQGKIGGISDLFEKNPDAFTITDNSSGSDHEYLYRKAGVNDKGQPVYKCVSMNGNPITTDNQYTLQWTEDGRPELVQYDDQDNYGVGLQVGKNDNKPPEYETAPGDYTGDEGPYETAPGDGDAVRTDDSKENPPQIWLNKQPVQTVPGHTVTLDDIKQDLISKCEATSRPLSDAEKEAVNQCQSEQEAIAYLRSLGIQVSYAM